ncbi:beta-ketoacyl synthase N-terminal-like domain-containing protein [Bacillus halotolerans]|uniref:beta-ketoacyl synthase N-terminal-like domain-containing protein n=1 Tax=Bacillus halotolerans TaxID=260554 RepID=UPI002281E282|nr:beta-ketoacyl synthase N-terminal-like domain-containing protein [Bacillus halotolerans]MCY8472948.1 thioesterase domain-containing protein [Bacillus halotolerans]
MRNTEDILCKMLLAQLQSIGFFKENKPQPVLQNFYGRWFEESLSILERHGFLQQTSNGYAVTRSTEDINELWYEWDEKKADLLQDSNMKAMVVLVETALKALPDILTGKASATDILFPNSSMELVEGIYKNNQVADYFNDVLADTLAAFMQERLKQEPEARIRILEIGAGTGGTSAAVFQKMKAYQSHIKEYCYTDLSKAFLLHAEKMYGPDNPYLTYKVFNVEEPAAEQHIEVGGYDVIVAANVLHATKNIRQTLRNAKAVLKKNGLLLLNEINDHNIYSHLTFGLLEGWWLYEDPDLRIPGCPGLYPDSWKMVLESEGFRYVSFMAEQSHQLGQQIIAAESDGIVRQKTRTEKPAEEIIDYHLDEHHSQTKDSDEDSLLEQTTQFVKHTLAKSIKLSPERIHAETTFEKYGIDSILQVNFIRELEKLTGELPKTILFEHSNTKELVDFLIKEHEGKLRTSLLKEKSQPANKETSIQAKPVKSEQPFTYQTRRFSGDQQLIKTQQAKANPKSETETAKNVKALPSHRTTPNHYGTEDIAIIGISGRYPMSENVEELWEHLIAGDNCITEAPQSRWRTSLVNTLSKESLQSSDKKRYGGFLKDIHAFDHHLFEADQNQVMEMTPELRLFLETVWETFEDGGYSQIRLNELQDNGTGVGVFVGNMYNQYFWNIPSLEQAVLSSNGGDWHIANRVSHFFNLTGPSLAVSSACSSSLNAIHLACESLKLKNCSMAIAGGVNLTLDLSKYDALERANLLENGNQSKSFGTGSGLIPGEGVGAVLLKPLSKAIEDHDHIYAVIKSSFANHSGGRQMYTAPDPKQQAALISKSIQQSGIDPETIGYIESAANGSALGDPIEVIALSNAFHQYTNKKQFCGIGSVKSNLGHLEAASGISQLTKVLLQMKKGTLVPTINATPVNPNINLENTAFYLQKRTEPWQRLKDPDTGKHLPRRSMINSFGAGGAYANLIIEEFIGAATEQQHPVPHQQEYLAVFSAKTKWSLLSYLEKLRVFLEKKPSSSIGAVVRSLHRINHDLEHRAAFSVSSTQELIEKLKIFQKTKESSLQDGIYTSFDLQSDAISTNAGSAHEETSLTAQQWAAGASIHFDHIHQGNETGWINLPHYAFDHQTVFQFGALPHEEGKRHDEQTVNHPLIQDLFVYDEPYVQGHVFNKERVLVGATYASLAIDAFFEMFPEEISGRISKLSYLNPVVINQGQTIEVKADPLQKDHAIDLQIMYRERASETWKPAAIGQCQKDHFETKKVNIESVKRSLTELDHIDQMYQTIDGGAEWGDLYKTITHLYRGNNSILAKVRLSQNGMANAHHYTVSPLITNSAYLAILSFTEQLDIEGHFFPFGINDIQFTKNKIREDCWLLITFVKNTGEMLLFDIDVMNEASETVLRYSGYSLKQFRLTDRGSKEENQEVQMHDIRDRIRSYLTDKLAEKTANPSKLSLAKVHIMDLGIDSSQLIALSRELESETKIELNPTLFFEYPSLQELVDFFAEKHEKSFVQLFGGVKQQQESPNIKENKTKQVQTYERKTDETKEYTADGIAIIGMSGQFPKANNVTEFWDNLIHGRNCISEVPEERWDWRKYTENTDGKQSSLQWGGFIEGIGEFDPLFFGISPKEAATMDPQEFLLLTHAWKAMEDAGITGQALSSCPTGVFVAAGNTDAAVIPSLMPNRISYALNVKGPSEYYEAACSSALVALHRAIQSIRNGECEQAIVGAVNLLLSPKGFIGFDSMGYLSAEGKAKSFQAEANGFVRSEGAGVLIIKPLQKAIEDSDHIYSVIKGTGVSHGGRGMSLHAPNPIGMKDAMKKAYQGSQVDPKTVTYIEAHGIASPVADVIEVEALKSGYRQLESEHSHQLQGEMPCYISSLKPSIGHGELVSGMAALMKVSMAMQHKTIPGIPGFDSLNDQVSIKETRFRMIDRNQQWEEIQDDAGRTIPRRASINSYGFGGINAHIILEEYVPSNTEPAIEHTDEPHIVVLSAKNQDRLRAVVQQMLDYVKQQKELSLQNYAYTLQVGREEMSDRMALIIRSKDELVLGLEEYLTAAEKAEKPKSTVPCFIGNLEEGLSDIGALLEGTLGDIVMQTLLSENHLEKIAFCWAKGVQIPWEQLHRGKGARRISLPAYPFEKRNCWNGFLSPEIAPAFSNAEIPLHKRNDIQMISDVLGMTPEELNPQKALQDYGFDSIVCIQLLQQLQAEAGLSISLAELQTCQTVQNMVDLIATKRENTVQDQSVQTVSRSFPELIPLNDGKRGRPVFWFHGGVGGVEIYTPFAKKSQRPFYGIQARGFMTNHAPLHGIEQMASYYIDIMRAVQPEGPYDVGGYSLGGLLAYEVTRQLQRQGLAVKSMVMIDSPYSPGREQNEPSVKTSMLQTINTMLASIVQPEKLKDVLISREEVDVDREEEEFLTELIGLARKRGLNKPEKRIRTQLNQMVKAQHAYEFEAYTVQPLVDPEAVKCYYFRNKSRSFLGDLDIYFAISNEKIPLDDTAYWEEWERQIPQFHLVDVDSSNHMMMLTESKASSAMLEFCEKLYSNRGVVNANFLKAFRKKHEASEENADELVKR